MSDDVFTTGSDEAASEDTAPQEPEEPMAGSFPDAADAGGDDGGGLGMLGPIEIPSTSRLLVGLGGAVMALSTLLSWVEVNLQGFPNVAGAGFTTRGVGLAVLLVGLAFLLRRMAAGITLGMALGAFGATLIFIVLVGTGSGRLGAGAWVGLIGAAIALLGALLTTFESDDRPGLEFHPMPAAAGAVLAVIASFWLDWVPNPGSWIAGHDRMGYSLSGVDMAVLFGLPVLILGGIALIFTVDLVSVPRKVLEGRRQALLLICQVAGIAIVVIAGSNALNGAFFGFTSFGSAPIVALVGGIMLTRSIKEA